MEGSEVAAALTNVGPGAKIAKDLQAQLDIEQIRAKTLLKEVGDLQDVHDGLVDQIEKLQYAHPKPEGEIMQQLNELANMGKVMEDRKVEYYACSSKIDRMKEMLKAMSEANAQETVIEETNTPDETQSQGQGQSLLTEADFQRALQRGKKAWGRSKLMIVGEGRAGKTALANSIIGRAFEDTDSTVGINQLTCDIKYAAVGGGGGGSGAEEQWSEYVKPQRELEAALAQMLMDERLNRASPSSQQQVFDGLDAWTNEEEQGCVDELSASAAGVPPIDSHRHHRQGVPAPVKATAAVLNNELIMKCLADRIHTESKFVVSLFDFGGQSVFNVIHHFFLTRCGVYLLVFNMEWLAAGNAADKETCLAYLSFWLNSIIIHTRDADGCTAPVLLVGTRKDRVTDPAEHEAISLLLYNEFKSSLAWKDIVENQGAEGRNGRIDLFFFPVDNTAGRSDPTMQRMMKAVEDAIDASAYVHAEQPLSWLQALDLMNARDAPCLAYKDIEQLAASCDIPAAMVPKFLRFLHEMAALMWHEEDGLRDTVIMNPIAYFVTPATTIICKHAPSAEDPVYHSLEIHKKVKKQHMADWEDMLSRGMISRKLLEALLAGAVPVNEQRTRIAQLMLKYGLLVEVEQSLLSNGNDNDQPVPAGTQRLFLAPALLPLQPATMRMATDDEPERWSYGSAETTFYFLFSASGELDKHTTISWQDCQQHGFLPSGLFERLICKAISWSQATSLASDAVQISSLFKDEAILSFGLQRFRLLVMPRQHVIRVEVEGRSPLGVQAGLRNLIEKVISECMKSLTFLTILQFHNGSGKLFVRLNQIRQASKGRTALNLLGSSGRSMLSDQEVHARYGAWLTEFQVFDRYDVFLSYRWGKHDSNFVQALFDVLTLFTVQAERRAVQVFMDSRRLRQGLDFQAEFTNALVHSTVVCPIVSVDALLKMQDHHGDEEDNVLLEWIIMVACAELGQVKAVLPILFGSVNDGSTGKLGDFFAEGWLSTLPAVQPAKCMKLAGNLLSVHGIALSEGLQQLSVQDIVRRITKFLCINTWSMQQHGSVGLVREVAQSVVKNVEQCLASTSDNNSHPHGVPQYGAVSGGGSTVLLDSLSVEQMCQLLRGIGLEQYTDAFLHNSIDGRALRCCDSVDDLKEVGVTKGMHAKKLLTFAEEWRISGVSVDVFV